MHVNRIQVAIREKQNDTNPETNGTLRDLSSSFLALFRLEC
jgi:hypothetical protein